MNVNTDHHDVAIAGGGITGLALASALADALGEHARIVVVDRAPFEDLQAAKPDGRALAVSAGSKSLLAMLGAWAPLVQHAQAVTAVDITDSSLDDAIRPVLVSYDNHVQGEPATWIIENWRVREALLAAARTRSGISLRGGAAGKDFSVDAGGVTLNLANGESIRAALLVAADGAGSPLRDAAAISAVRWTYKQTGIVTTVRHDKPHGGKAVQHFLPAGPFAILPLAGNRACVTWTEDADRARQILTLDDAAFTAEVEKRFGYRLGRVELDGGRTSAPLAMHLARALVVEKFALLGDAAHGVHPIAGQGLNLGLRDVAALTEVVADAARLGLDIGSLAILERYERWRRLDSALSAASFDGLNRLFSNDWAVLRTARDFGLGVVDRLPGLKQFFVAEAAGLTGEIPKLLRGEAV